MDMDTYTHTYICRALFFSSLSFERLGQNHEGCNLIIGQKLPAEYRIFLLPLPSSQSRSFKVMTFQCSTHRIFSKFPTKKNPMIMHHGSTCVYHFHRCFVRHRLIDLGGQKRVKVMTCVLHIYTRQLLTKKISKSDELDRQNSLSTIKRRNNLRPFPSSPGLNEKVRVGRSSPIGFWLFEFLKNLAGLDQLLLSTHMCRTAAAVWEVQFRFRVSTPIFRATWGIFFKCCHFQVMHSVMQFPTTQN